MRILYLHQYFKTPEEGGAIRSWYIANALTQAGHKVEIISGGPVRKYVRKEMNGFTVHYLPDNYNNSLSKFQRIGAFARFAFFSLWFALGLEKFDKIYATSTPLTIGFTALILKWVKKTPFIFEVRDLWPEAPIQMGFIKNPILKKLLWGLEIKTYQHAESIVALSLGIQDGIQKKVGRKNILLVPNMSDCELFMPAPKNSEFEKKYGAKDKFVVSYTGSIGFSNQVEYLLEAAYSCQDNKIDQVLFLVVGQGSQLAELIEKSQKMDLKNIQFLGHLDKHEISKLLNISDAIYVSFAQFPILETNSPNKFFDGLAASKIIITNTKGWIKDLVEEYECGFYYHPNDTDSFVEKIRALLENPQKNSGMKSNSRRLAEEKFSVDQLTKKIMVLFN